MWETATRALEQALESRGIAYKVNPGDGAFYGPKIDFHVKDCIGRTWQCGTVQLDFSMPERFELEYIGPDNRPHRPVMVHRAALGSFERFLGILIEHTEGRLPLWLAPTQVAVIAIRDSVHDYAAGVAAELAAAGVRARADLRSEHMNVKIREAQHRKVPLMLVLGEKEREAGTVAVRFRSGKQRSGLTVGEFLDSVYRPNLHRPEAE
jgi:threonyl-tRNA synthetase